MAHDADWSAWALLLIDVQRDFWTPEHEQGFPNFPGNVGNLLAFCRRVGIEVVHVRSRFRADRSDWMPTYKLRESIPVIAGTGGDEVVPFAAQEPSEAVFVKQTFDAFHVPELLDHLRAGGRRILLTAGLETSFCVLLTSTAACQHGFLTVMVEDCSADLPDYDPGATQQYLSRYEGRIFWRTTVSDLPAAHADWMARLSAIDASTP